MVEAMTKLLTVPAYQLYGLLWRLGLLDTL
jgi:hypothetical protein